MDRGMKGRTCAGEIKRCKEGQLLELWRVEKDSCWGRDKKRKAVEGKAG